MRVVPFDESNWKKDHPTGSYRFPASPQGRPAVARQFHVHPGAPGL